MLNAFDAANYPTEVPAAITRGMRVAWRDVALLGAYPASAYTWRFVARPEAGETAGQGEIAISGSAVGSAVTFTAAASATGAWQPGRYLWQVQVTRTSDDEVVTARSGVLRVAANQDTESDDQRSSARVALAHLEAYERGNRSPAIVNYSIGTRSVGHMTAEERIRLIQYYRHRVAAEERASLAAAGRPTGMRVRARFAR